MDSQSSQLSSLSRSSQTGTSFGHSEFSQEETSSIANKLSKKLGKDHTASRVGAGNCKFFSPILISFVINILTLFFSKIYLYRKLEINSTCQSNLFI